MNKLQDRLNLCANRLSDAMNELEAIEENSLEHRLYQKTFDLWQQVTNEIHKMASVRGEVDSKSGRVTYWPKGGTTTIDSMQDALEDTKEVKQSNYSYEENI
jgi:hypothetical protein